MEPPKCLIVDDESLILTMLTEFIGQLGYHCQTAISGEVALRLLVEGSYDLMITDISMGAMDGIELTRLAKELYPDMPIIIMTGFTDQYTYDAAIEAGAADFLKKPFTLREIQARIARIMRDMGTMAFLKRKEHELGTMSTEMISGLQEEVQQKLQVLEEEIARLKKEVGRQG